MSTDLKQDVMNAVYEGYMSKKTVPVPMPSNYDSNTRRISPPAPNKKEIIIRLVESLNIGGKEGYYERVDIAFMQYEQIQKKLKPWEDF